MSRVDAPGAPSALADGAPALPCLNSNISNGPTLPEALERGLRRLSTSHRKTAFALAFNVARLCAKYGIERIGFLTLTFADHVTCAKEAGKRFNSLRTGVLAERYVESICVLERMKSGRIHFHLLVVLPHDIRTGFDFEQAANGEYTSANPQLRAEWSFWRATAKRYGFGRTELLPVKSNEEGLSKYVGKYIAKHIGARENRDKGVRLVRYSRDAKPCGTAFAFVSPRGKLWRVQVAEFAKRNGCVDLAAVKAKFGPKWAHVMRRDIMAIEPPLFAVFERGPEGEPVALWDVWHGDRIQLAMAAAAALGCTEGEAFATLFQSSSRSLAFSVPRWSGVNLAREAAEAEWERTVIWADGTTEKDFLPSKARGGTVGCHAGADTTNQLAVAGA